MADLTFKLGDIYDGYSQNTTRELSLPDAEDVEKLSNGETNKEAEQITNVTTSGASKKSIIIAVCVLAGLGILLGVARG